MPMITEIIPVIWGYSSFFSTLRSLCVLWELGEVVWDEERVVGCHGFTDNLKAIHDKTVECPLLQHILNAEVFKYCTFSKSL